MIPISFAELILIAVSGFLIGRASMAKSGSAEGWRLSALGMLCIWLFVLIQFFK